MPPKSELEIKKETEAQIVGWLRDIKANGGIPGGWPNGVPPDAAKFWIDTIAGWIDRGDHRG